MNFGKIRNNDIANGTGIRVTIFVSGCRNHCDGCFQPETWNFDYGDEFTEEAKEYIYSLVDKSYIRGITILGGEPFEPENQAVLVPFVEEFRSKFPDKDVWCYTGFTIEDILDSDERCCTDISKKFVSLIDYLVDGRFIEDKKDISLKFRGSSNQRIINVDLYMKERKL